MGDFKLEIQSQHWISDDPAGRYEDGSTDACSHGSIYCEIGGVQVTEDDGDYGIAQSALQLLRTLEEDRVGTRPHVEAPYDEGFLLCHGCGYPLGFGCTNYGTDWHVRHSGELVTLSDARFGSHAIVPAATVTLPLDAYRREVVAFAQEARRFYFSFGERRPEDWEQRFHEAFWAEYDERLERAEAALAAGNVRDNDTSGSSEA